MLRVNFSVVNLEKKKVTANIILTSRHYYPEKNVEGKYCIMIKKRLLNKVISLIKSHSNNYLFNNYFIYFDYRQLIVIIIIIMS